MSEHPDLVRPTFSKGIGYFDVNYDRGMRWYRGHFPVSSLARVRHRAGRPVAFESSGYYAFHPLAAGRIARDLPGVRVVMMVRDPVERAHSAYKHEFARGFETEPFAEAIALEPERLRGEVDRMVADPAYVSFEHRHHAYVGRGEYATQVERFRAELGDDRVYVLDADDFFAEPVPADRGAHVLAGSRPLDAGRRSSSGTPDRATRSPPSSAPSCASTSSRSTGGSPS